MPEIGPLQQRILLLMLRFDEEFIAAKMAEFLGCHSTSSGVAMKYLARRGLLECKTVRPGPRYRSIYSYILTKEGVEEAKRWDRLSVQSAEKKTST